MPAHYPVPIQEDVRDLLVDLLGRGVAVDKVGALELEDHDPALIAAYVDDDGAVGALCMVDGPFANRAGAALSMVPAVVAEESVGKAVLADNLVENTEEIVNILARLLNSARTPHLKLGGVHRLPGDLPEGVIGVREHPEFRRDFAVSIEGYGEGRFSLLVV
jgi:hypothetical protein